MAPTAARAIGLGAQRAPREWVQGRESPKGATLRVMATKSGSSAPASLIALGVVFGDIGTSPLYALQLCFSPEAGLGTDPRSVLGVLCLVFWSLTVVISLKYLAYLLRADLSGEGGILALMALANAEQKKRVIPPGAIFIVGIFGAALLYGDGMITPAISVLSAVEGVGVATTALKPLILPLTVGILFGIFAIQRHGTERVGMAFGPVMLLWFAVLFVLGLQWILKAPEVLLAVDPRYGVSFFMQEPERAFGVLGFVFLVVTGGEALYADLGHFGKRAIRQAWFVIVFPAVTVNYFGQGARMLLDPKSSTHTFFDLAPAWALWPLVILATTAAVIASQAVISGAFSLTFQCFRLRYAPRIEVVHYADDSEGRVYVPLVNWILFAMSVVLVLGFGSSQSLANAYGVAVATTMVITTLLACVVFGQRWGWPIAIGVTLCLLAFDLPFFFSNIGKVPEGGWVPLAVAAFLFAVLTTWKKGRTLELRRLEKLREEEQQWLDSLSERAPERVEGTAVFFDERPAGIPRTLIRNVMHNRVLHEKVVILSVATDPVPRVSSEHRFEFVPITDDLFRINAHYGYMQQPNVPAVLRALGDQGFEYEPDSTTFFLEANQLQVTKAAGMTRWRKRVFAFLSRNAKDATETYRVPADRMISMGVRIPL
uniref:Probable potassium transport system protein Kup n=1 Tax=uncultured myxobacterium HF0200_01L06 TaxID=723556 RepID=E7C3I6_9BACT|nr:K+ transporter [uncultured myxobacterium HF0200_01L06]